ncbi:fimbria/pilus periplasmic chaperone [Escherichia coli]|uniref:fimbrial biogenesis chaperone n=1 Tax=Escherichia coli TaxID=562 RepID=UPI000B7DD209|nr:fimbria/pilus periplasmic chaperone [Escherichia coli]EEW1584970.1 molecular chaperone [Escherichia coli]EFD0486697.1 molecular chaperone [Escherichia coli]EIY0410485.1 fimbria/pilus periplasmic chaperone [Escherichia coli]MCZ5139951.1 fimbria/pilus periplasmic chaperone [Escherichia coli]MCZ6323778.1 fimbria/pilus periplasmic chaperone [Escherichia coli]
MKKIASVLAMLFPIVVYATELNTTTRSYSIVLGASRVVMKPGNEAYNLPVENKQDYPVLIETTILNEDSETKSNRYVVTPPLFRLDGGQKNSISIIKENNDFPEQVESMNWVCVKSIPPSEGSAWIKNDDLKNSGSLNVTILVKNCIKLINRPKSLEDIKNASYGSELKWSIDNGRLIVENPTPYYINFGALSVNGQKITPPVFVNPKSFFTFEEGNIKSNKGKVVWQLIDDYGALTNEYETLIK